MYTFSLLGVHCISTTYYVKQWSTIIRCFKENCCQNRRQGKELHSWECHIYTSENEANFPPRLFTVSYSLNIYIYSSANLSKDTKNGLSQLLLMAKVRFLPPFKPRRSGSCKPSAAFEQCSWFHHLLSKLTLFTIPTILVRPYKGLIR